MKRILFITSLFLGLSVAAHSQTISPKAIGLRLGTGTVSDVEISFQKALGGIQRLELDLGFSGGQNYSSGSVAAILQWDFNIVEDLNWYIGPGAALGLYTWSDGNGNHSGASVGLGGQVGIEYNLINVGAPILISLDTRPMYKIAQYSNGAFWGVALAVRYLWK